MRLTGQLDFFFYCGWSSCCRPFVRQNCSQLNRYAAPGAFRRLMRCFHAAVVEVLVSVRVLFVCLGNICRSPMAEAVFQQMVNEAGLARLIAVDSAGIGAWHAGEKAHPGTRRILAAHNIAYQGRARQITAADMADPHTYVVAMDNENMDDLRRRFGDHPRLYRLLDFATETDRREVPDPYYTGKFDLVYRLVVDGCQGLLAKVRADAGI